MRHAAYGPDASLDSLRIADSEAPAPKPGEVLVEVHYAGVNGPDIVQRKGLYPPPPDASPSSVWRFRGALPPSARASASGPSATWFAPWYPVAAMRNTVPYHPVTCCRFPRA